MPKFAANLTMLFNEFDFLERFEQASKVGFKAVEFLWPYAYDKKDLSKLIKDLNLEVALFNTSAGDTVKGQWGRAAIPGCEQDAMEDIEKALDYAIALDCKTIHVMAGVIPHPWEKELCRQVFIKNMRKAADLFAKHNKFLTIEALCPESKPNYLYHSQYETLVLMEEIAKDNVFIQLDIYHAQMVDGNLSYLIKNYAGKYAHVQVSAAHSRHEPDEGEINYDYIFKLFDEVGYKGFIGCEYNPRGSTMEGLQWIKPYLR